VRLGRDHLEAALLGGGLLGGGGGGSLTEGRALGQAALRLGTPSLVRCHELPVDAWVATVSLVGAPAAPDRHVEPQDHERAWAMLVESCAHRPSGIVASENGGTASVNGWIQSAVTGLPVVDAPADGRAHPTGDMGSLALERLPGFISEQAVAGGTRAHGLYLEQWVRAPLAPAGRLVRAAAEAAGGLVAVARNPVPVRWLARHGAVGGLTQALELGRVMIEARPGGGPAVAERVCERLGGRVAARGEVEAIELQTRGGYDVGIARVAGVELSIWNEYLALERGGQRLATFPDLVATLDAATGDPVTSAELAPGRLVIVVTAPAASLVLGGGLRVRANYLPLERAVGKDLLAHVAIPFDDAPDMDLGTALSQTYEK